LHRSDLAFAHALLTGFIEHQTLMYGLVINENKSARFSGHAVADEAVAIVLSAYGKKSAKPKPSLAVRAVATGLPPVLAHL
jgi:hypothetical protein